MTRTNDAGETRTAIAACATTPAGDALPVYPHTMRLQRFLARAGVASRRGSEDLMTAGRVTVNGQIATELGTKVDVDRDHIEVDGMPVKLNQGAVYLMLYKPTGYLTTMSDPQERPCVADLVPRDRFPGLFPVGRIGRDTPRAFCSSPPTATCRRNCCIPASTSTRPTRRWWTAVCPTAISHRSAAASSSTMACASRRSAALLPRARPRPWPAGCEARDHRR